MQVSVRFAGARKVAALLALLAAAAPVWGDGPDISALTGTAPPANAIWLDSLDLSSMTTGVATAQAGKSISKTPLTLQGTVYPHGVGTHVPSSYVIDLKGVATQFQSVVGVDDEAGKGKGTVDFTVSVDGKQVADSGVLHSGDPPKLLTVNLTGAKQLTLTVSPFPAMDSGHSDWAGALIRLVPGTTTLPGPVAQPLFPSAPALISDSPRPAIHAARLVGASPGRPFLFLVAATGDGPLTYSCADLPKGLALDRETGIITGALAAAGTATVHLVVKGPNGEADAPLTIVCGEGKRALTPPMGWNAWNVFGDQVNDADIREAADWMVKTGLAAHGYTYIVIDDSWQGIRDKKTGEILPNHLRFPNMKGLADYVHSKGLKLGILSAPTEHTCGGFIGSMDHEAQDAQTFAGWGIDYVKYSWCPVFIDEKKPPADMKAAYALMGNALNKSGRDIVFEANTFGRSNPWDWAAQSGANSWVTSQELYDTWGVLSPDTFGAMGVANRASQGHWNDPGELQIGQIGYPSLHWSHLTPAEQMTQVSMWCLLAAPLMLDCDLTHVDPNMFHRPNFALLANDDVLAIDQDPSGQPMYQLTGPAGTAICARALADGTTAVGLFNSSDQPALITVNLSDLKLTGSQPVRDLWQLQDLGAASGIFSANVPPHGVVLVKIGTPGPIKLAAL